MKCRWLSFVTFSRRRTQRLWRVTSCGCERHRPAARGRRIRSKAPPYRQPCSDSGACMMLHEVVAILCGDLGGLGGAEGLQHSLSPPPSCNCSRAPCCEAPSGETSGGVPGACFIRGCHDLSMCQFPAHRHWSHSHKPVPRALAAPWLLPHAQRGKTNSLSPRPSTASPVLSSAKVGGSKAGKGDCHPPKTV